jgi:hypothetical protein
MLLTAEQALVQTAPNGRDYYPQGADALGKATDEHLARMQKVRDVIKELQEMAEHVDTAPGPR